MLMAWWVGAAAASLPPTELVRDTANRVLTMFSENRAALEHDPEGLYQLVHAIVLPHFDFERMARLVLGKHWRDASDEQRARFTSEFRSLLVRTYGKALEAYEDQEILYLPMRGSESDGNVLVRTEIRPPDGFPVPINYALYRVGEDWKVYDVVIDNVSLVTNYRSTFATDIRRQGLDGLIAHLVEHNQKAGLN